MKVGLPEKIELMNQELHGISASCERILVVMLIYFYICNQLHVIVSGL